MSLVDTEISEQVKKHFYISGEDEYNCSSEALNGLVLSTVLKSMPSYRCSRKVLKHGYLADLVREGGVSPCSLLLGLIYIRRLVLTNKEYLSTISSRDLFLVSMVVASKYLNDEGEMEALTNSEWSAIGNTHKSTLDEMERDFLKAIDWRLYVPVQEFYMFVASAEGRVAMEKACDRGWLTYSELLAVWQSTDWQASMLKHTAKVAINGAALYLVCVTTLLAAMHSLSPLNPDPATSTSIQQDVAPPNVLSPSNSSLSSPLSHMLPNSDPLPLPWEEVWPGDMVCLKDVCSKGSVSRVMSEHSFDPGKNRRTKHMLKSDSSLPKSTRTPLCTPVNLTQDTRLQDTGLRETRNNSGYESFSSTTAYSSSTHSSNHLTSPWYKETLDQTHYTTSRYKETLEQTPIPLQEDSRYRIITKATVDMLQAIDLTYSQRGTFHWDPLISSNHNGSAAGVLTFIASYLNVYL